MKENLLLFSCGSLLLSACASNNPEAFIKYAEEQKQLTIKSAQEQKQLAELSHKTQLKQLQALNDYKQDSAKRAEEIALLRAEIKQLAQTKTRNTSVENASESLVKIAALTDPAIKKAACTLMGLIGNDECEAELLKLFKHPKNDVSLAALQALKVMGSKQMKPLVFETAIDSETAPSLRHKCCEILIPIADKKMTATLIKLAEITCSSEDYYDRYARSSIYKTLLRIAVEKDYADLMNLYQLENHHKGELMNVIIKLKGINSKFILDTLANNTDKNGIDYQTLKTLSTSADIRLTKGIIPLLESTNYQTRRAVIPVFAKLQDPLAAKALIKQLSKNSDSSFKRSLQELFENNYPGIEYDSATKKAKLIDAEKLQELIDARNEKVKNLE